MDLRVNDCHIISTRDDKVHVIPVEKDGKRISQEDAIKELVHQYDNRFMEHEMYYEGLLSNHVEQAMEDGSAQLNV